MPLLKAIGRMFPRLRHLFADRIYRGPKLLNAIAELGKWTIEIITRRQSLGTFKAEPRRWVIERTLAWFGRNRRLSKDFEQTIASAEVCKRLRALSTPGKSLKPWALLLSPTLRLLSSR